MSRPMFHILYIQHGWSFVRLSHIQRFRVDVANLLKECRFWVKDVLITYIIVWLHARFCCFGDLYSNQNIYVFLILD